MPMSDTAKRVGKHPMLIARSVLALVAAAWGVFAFLGAADPEPSWTGYAYAGALTGLLAGLAVCSWLWPKWTGAVAVGAAVFVAGFFQHPAPQLAMAAPLALSGVLLLWHGQARGRKARGGPAPAPRGLDDDI